MSNNEHDEIDRLLREHSEGPVADAGFSAQVMRQLPPRRRVRWPLWSGVLIGALGCFLSLAAAPLLRTGVHDWIGGEPSLAALAAWATSLAIAWLALGWGMAESRDS